MSIILSLILAQLCLVCVSAMAIPPINAATIPIWDIERATSFNALLAASVENTRLTSDITSVNDSKIAPAQSAKVAGQRNTARKAKHLPSVKNMPNGGMQCAVM